MMTLAFDKPLDLLLFDHRGSLQSKMIGWEGRLTSEQAAQIAAAQQVTYDGFKAAVAAGAQPAASSWAGARALPPRPHLRQAGAQRGR